MATTSNPRIIDVDGAIDGTLHSFVVTKGDDISRMVSESGVRLARQIRQRNVNSIVHAADCDCRADAEDDAEDDADDTATASAMPAHIADALALADSIAAVNAPTTVRDTVYAPMSVDAVKRALSIANAPSINRRRAMTASIAPTDALLGMVNEFASAGTADKPVARYTYPAELADNPDARKRYRRMARKLARQAGLR